jgi:glycosyltransferase involved in cell wall biosynthesis
VIVSLVLPCYKPPSGWEQTICSAYSSFGKSVAGDVELIIVLDGESATVTKDALSFLEKNIPQLKLVKYPDNRGKGYAIRQGVVVASGEMIIYTDIDFPYTEASMRAIYDGLSKDEFEVGVGVKNDAYYAHVPFLRKVISHFLRFLIRIFLSMPVTDTQCGLKGFRRSVTPLFLQTTIDRYLFDLEFVRNCFKSKKYRVKAIPVTLNENVHFRSMDYRILLPEMVNFVKLLFK